MSYFGKWQGTSFTGQWWGDAQPGPSELFQCGLFQPDLFQNNCPPVVPPVVTPTPGGGYQFVFADKRSRILREDDDIVAFLASVLQSGLLH